VPGPRQLLMAAEAISAELEAQTAQLNTAIDQFNREILHPLREVLSETEGSKHVDS
jgi:hypothetical protein